MNLHTIQHTINERLVLQYPICSSCLLLLFGELLRRGHLSDYLTN